MWLAICLVVGAVFFLIYRRLHSSPVKFPSEENKNFYRVPNTTLLEKLLGGQLPTIIQEAAAVPQMRFAAEAAKRGATCVGYDRTYNIKTFIPLHPHDVYDLMLGSHASAKFIEKPATIWKGLADKFFGYGVLTLWDSDEHARQRRLMQPAFATGVLRGISETTMPKHTLKLVKKITADTKKQTPVDLRVEFDSSALAIAAESVFGCEDGKLPGDDDKENSVVVLFRKMINYTGINFVDTILGFMPSFISNQISTESKREVPKIRGKIEKVCDVLAQEQREKLEKKKNAANAAGGDDDDDDDDDDKTVRHSVFEVLVKNKSMDAEKIRANAIQLLAASHETSANALTWTCMHLAKHPKVQQELFEELSDVVALGAVPSDFDNDILPLPLLNAVVNESLRLSPPAPVAMREAQADILLPASQVTIPKGALIQFAPLIYGLSKRSWGEDADEFRPSRWLEERPRPEGMSDEEFNTFFISKPTRDVAPDGHHQSKKVFFAPWLFGRRDCIGKNFALREILMVLACIVRNFQLEWPEGVAWPPGQIKLAMRPKTSVDLKVTARQE